MAARSHKYEPIGFFDRLSVQRGWRQQVSQGFALRPDPLTIGSVAIGRDMLAGHISFGGHKVDLAGASLWDVTAPDRAFDAMRHGFGWLDDLAALANPPARHAANGWLWDWVDRNRGGQGIAWAPGLTGRRLLRWIFHAPFLMHGANADQRRLFLKAVSAHLWHLGRRGRHAPQGIDQIEALTAQIIAALCLEDRGGLAATGLDSLGIALGRMLGDYGSIRSRNPEELLVVAQHLNWIEEALLGADQFLPPKLAGARDAMALTLRSLRHADGSLPRFHGGDAGPEGVLERVLQTSPLRTRRDGRGAMGFARLSARRTTVIMDVSPPPIAPDSVTGHASTLAFELTSGRRPVVVNCGSGAGFGPDWRRAARSTAGHSVLSFEGHSSARFGSPDFTSGLEPIIEAPREVLCDFLRLHDADRIQGLHKGYETTHGLTHSRLLDLSHDGRNLMAEDRLLVSSDSARAQFDRMSRDSGGGIPFFVRFHLHPDVDASLGAEGGHVVIALASGEIWVLRGSAGVVLSLEQSVYLDPGEDIPRSAKQVVLSGRAMKYATSIRWSLRKTDDTALAVRDADRSEDDPYT